MAFVGRVLVSGAAIWVATLLLPGMRLVGAETLPGQVGVVLLVGLLFGLVNAVVKPVVAVLSLPLYVLTLGLFHLVVNALMLLLTAWISEQTTLGLRVDGFGTAFVGALVVSVVSWLLSALTRRDRD
ncbi:phage holin family protein [Cellulomonas marina]|uniref:Putative membrane protein n=1 Tax=Cellulomonas marina TaxID=988821 RepID=A0A1I0YF50_9CELL|nr:phage holin family protein [Cellulomonas marina]GIG28727.1 membrane protein [Cellulomonas marina]SFB11802.1 putative membrane protein [Cellulomonas marina]